MTDSTTLEHADRKQATRTQWDEAAEGWNASMPQIRAWLYDATQAMLTMAGVKPGLRVLDVAAGSGDQTLDVAAQIGPEGFVLATDLSPGILELAAQNAQRAGLKNVQTRVADGESLSVEDASFDAVVCRLGLMFFPDPLKGLREMHRALKPGGGICTMVFSTPQANPCVATVVRTALKHAGLPPRDPFQPGGLISLGKPGLIDDLFRNAGFRDVATTRMSAPFRLPSAFDYVQFIRTGAGPILQILSKLDETAKQAAWVDIEAKLRAFDTFAGWEGPNELLLTVARR